MEIKKYVRGKWKQYQEESREKAAYRKILHEKEKVARRQAYSESYIAASRQAAARQARNRFAERKGGGFGEFVTGINKGIGQLSRTSDFGNIGNLGLGFGPQRKVARKHKHRKKQEHRRSGRTIIVRV